MKTYDEFLTWAAEHHYTLWLNDYALNESRVAWGYLSSDVIGTAAAIYNKTLFDVNNSFKARLANLYGNPLSGTGGARNPEGW